MTVRLESEFKQHQQNISKLIGSLKALNRSLEAEREISLDDYRDKKIDDHIREFDGKIKQVGFVLMLVSCSHFGSHRFSVLGD